MLLSGALAKIDIRINDISQKLDKYRRWKFDKISDVDIMVDYKKITESLNRDFPSAEVNIIKTNPVTPEDCEFAVTYNLDYYTENNKTIEEKKIKENLFVAEKVKKLLEDWINWNSSCISYYDDAWDRSMQIYLEDKNRFVFKKLNTNIHEMLDNYFVFWRFQEHVKHAKNKLVSLNNTIYEASELLSGILKMQEDDKNAKKQNSMLALYKSQMDMLIQYKKEGLAIESEIFSMREKLIKMENEEDSIMLQKLLRTLDSI